MGFIRFLKDWTLPVAIAMGTVCYLTFYLVPALDRARGGAESGLRHAVSHHGIRYALRDIL